MQKEHLVSIGIPVYKEEAYHQRSLDIWLKQDYVNIGIVLLITHPQTGLRKLVGKKIAAKAN